MAEEFEIHCQKGDVVETVDLAESIVEVQTVQYPEAVGEIEDVLGEQVAVPVDDVAVGNPLRQQWLSALDVAHREFIDAREPCRIHKVG
ncbi:hypothetical protein AB0E01_40410 [Nocardia vinacea]|uniref:hypothetical protein n=1 Tax=Nocardia vinacea TaxID=96468 RepID=UPI0033C81940